MQDEHLTMFLKLHCMSNKSDLESDEDEDEDEPDEYEGPERGTRLEKKGQIAKKGPSCKGPGKGLFSEEGTDLEILQKIEDGVSIITMNNAL